MKMPESANTEMVQLKNIATNSEIITPSAKIQASIVAIPMKESLQTIF